MHALLRLLFVMAVGALAGCATSYNDGTKAAEAGNYALAEQMLVRAIREGDSVGAAWNNLGVVYGRTGRHDLALRSYNMGARHGNENSKANLRSLGRPVPPADLAVAAGVAVSPSTISTPPVSGRSATAASICNCKGYAGPGGPCYAGPGGPAYDGPGGPAFRGPGGACYAGPGGAEYRGPGGPAYDGPGGPRYDGPGGPAYRGPGGPAYDGPGGPCYSGPGGPCYSGPGGSGLRCPAVCR
jgi:hypothetical protein